MKYGVDGMNTYVLITNYSTVDLLHLIAFFVAVQIWYKYTIKIV